MIDGQIRLCRLFDGLLPAIYSVDGNRHFIDLFVPRYLRKGLTVYDVGGGKTPFFNAAKKKELSLTVVGVDISEQELLQAPAGAYDEIVCADITQYEGRRDADLVICQAVLEHVRDVEKAFTALASIVRPGGTILVFVPSKNALYARLNAALPENLKRTLLYSIFPRSRRIQGFPSYYDRCSPRDFSVLAGKHGLRVADAEFYYTSAYFTFFFPLHLLWRTWVLLYRAAAGEQAAETFSMALAKEGA